MSVPARIPADTLIASLRNQIADVLRPVLPRYSQVALLDFPNHTNVGDSAIWAGEMAYLGSLGCRIVYRCDLQGYSRAALAKRIGRGTVLLHGGGNLGDLWSLHQIFRETVIAAFADNPIIQFPQTIYFQDPANMGRARRIFNAHPNPTLLARDHRSLEIARNEFRATSLLRPDMALCLGPLRRPRSPVTDVVCLLRTDVESATSRPPPAAGGIETTDWLAEPPTVLTRTHNFLHRQRAHYPRRLAPLRWLFEATYTPVARQRVARGCRLHARGRVVVTDRLHGHILALLLGQPHVLLDNSYGKLDSFVHSWTTDCELTYRSDSIEDAVRLARALAS